MSHAYDLIVLGAGPGGYVAAIRAAQLGMKVACVDENERLGGTCLRVGCIPSKALLESSHRYAEIAGKHLDAHGIRVGGVELDLSAMLARKDAVVDQLTRGIAGLFKKHRIEHVRGRGRLQSGRRVEVTLADGTTRSLEGRFVLVATGSVPATLPGVELDGDRIGTSTEALAYPEVPARLVVIGAGYIGLEMGSVWSRLGSEVTLLEYAPHLLPAMDREVSRKATSIFRKQGLSFVFGAKVTGAERTGDEVKVRYETKDGPQEIVADRVLVSVGRRPNTSDLGLAEAGVETNDRGFVVVDEAYRTTAEGVYAIGDVIGGAMLAHKAEEEGIAAVENMAGGHGHVSYDAIPGIVYTHPEIAAVGRTEQQLEEAGVPYRKGVFPFMANGRAKAMGETDGFVKVLAHAETDRLLGVHILGAGASELAAEAAVAMEFSASAEDLALCVHAHPTLSETVKEAALACIGRVIHL
ncbi:MAG: dihydrolipoyl dehydrogenase [Deltaproteobacteria bacterium]|nr:MAG: dihydrolipoyl dehydrogenase [Deltaproteobacteria bacterium]